jgi:endogenous inhibitor of DNA gyrase (YacG/DUF329 family)
MSQPANTLQRPCAICGKPQVAEFTPFCSKRCSDVDLGRWLKGNYVVPGRDVDESERPASQSPDDEAPEE